MLSVKQGGIKYHFLSLWYDSTWDWTPASRAIGERSTTKPTGWSVGMIDISYFRLSHPEYGEHEVGKKLII